MNSFQYIVNFAVQLAIFSVPLFVAGWLIYALRRRRLSAEIAVDAPLGCRTSRAVESIVISLGCVILVILAVSQQSWRSLSWSDAAKPH